MRDEFTFWSAGFISLALPAVGVHALDDFGQNESTGTWEPLLFQCVDAPAVWTWRQWEELTCKSDRCFGLIFHF